MPYTYDFPRPGLTADCVVFGLDGAAGPRVLLIQRKKHPFEGCWAVPGGFIEEGEDPLEAAQRELREETGLANLPMNQFHCFGRPGRDPRGWVVTIAHWTVVRIGDVHLRAGDDAARAEWFPIGDLPPLAFDHDQMLAKAVESLRVALMCDQKALKVLPEGVTAESLKADLETSL